MNTHSYYSPLSPDTFETLICWCALILSLVGCGYLFGYNEANPALLSVTISIAVTLVFFFLAETLYTKVYRPFLRWWHTTRVDRDSEMAPAPLMLVLDSQVHAMYLGELCSGTYVGRSPSGGYSVRLDGGPVVSSSEVYLKLD